MKYVFAALLVFLVACAPAADEPTVCAADVKECSDGSFVSRDPENNCQFPECPENNESDYLGPPAAENETVNETRNDTDYLGPPGKEEPVFCTQDVKQCPDGSYVGRDPQNGCAFRPCPSETAR